ncbi:nucleoside hydrolase [Obba rivulosa]|uniref:Nucleoside hydrolase n=1 Tax=Obba rivulosa TaxID=1052685 RepID=A0A8E2DSJ5_9APHY|nr:nucleoside hydrolase [Obba rivulosa]
MAAADRSQRTPVIIDTDPGVDDTLAILLALTSPELEILAIVISFGDTPSLNVLKIYQAVARHLDIHPEDKSRFPNFSPSRKAILARGVDGPLQGDLHSAQYFHGRDGLGDISHRHPDLNVTEDFADAQTSLQVTNRPGVNVVLELLRTEPERSISYLALGPLTNLAQAMRLDGDLVRDRIGRVVCMGGALDVPGNTSPVAEFNFFADPYAVRELLTPPAPSRGLPLERFVLLPLDITTPHELPFPIYTRKVDPSFHSTKQPSQLAGKPPITHFTSAFLERTREIMLEFGKDAMELHDIVAVWCAIANPPVPEQEEGAMPALTSGWRAIKRKFDVERIGELTRGMLVVDRRDDQGAYAPGANRAEVQAELERHSFQHAGELESTAVPAQVEVEDRAAAVKALAEQTTGGVACVTETPGPAALVELMLKRIWGVDV